MAAPKKSTKGGSVAGTMLVVLLKALFVVFVILTPLLGAWTSSSLAAYANGPVWLVAIAGLLLFPVLPGLWEGIAELRHRRKADAAPRLLTRGDRLLLRTLALNVVFLGVIWFSSPRAAFRALSARGDWMLDGQNGPTANAVRGFLFKVAGGLEFVYDAAHKSSSVDSEKPVKKGDGPAPLPRGDTVDVVDDTDPSQPKPPPTPTPAPEPKAFDPVKPWPSASEPSPQLAEMKPEDEASIAAVARFALDHQPDPMLRFKLLHDWVAMHVIYDVPALSSSVYPPQDAETVFKEKKGVCAGYAHLLKALGDAAELRVEFVGGVAKGPGNEVDGGGHAWNTVEIGGRDYLADATWDAGTVGPSPEDPSPHFHKGYKTEFLFTPPDIFINDHFPDEDRFQFLPRSLTRGDFMRLPQMRPSFFAKGLRLVSPDRSQVTVSSSLDIVIERSQEMYLMVGVKDAQGADAGKCKVDRGARFDIHCTFDRHGSYRVLLFVSPVHYGTYQSVGELSVLDR